MLASMIKKNALLLCFLIASQWIFSQKNLISNSSKVSVITCGTGNESYSLFGHTALRIQDPANALDLVYNYGAFDFQTPNFVMKFVKGDLQYFAAVHTFPEFISQYQYEERAVFEQELRLSTTQKQDLFNALNESLTSGSSYYTYKFIDKNCTSMVVDLINKTLQTKLIVNKSHEDETYRAILFPYFQNHFYEKLGTSIIFGTKVDQQGTQLFLPFQLLESLKKIQYQNNPIVSETKTLLSLNKEAPFSYWNNPYTYFALLFFIVVLNKRFVNIFFLSIMACIGLFFSFAWFYSLHLELANNYNIFLFNPTLLGFLLFFWRKNKRGIYRLALFNLLCLFVYLVIMINKVHLILVLPLLVTSGIILVRIAIQNKRRIPIII
ncbi:hypothetical protein FVB9288_00532 [Flavobacterium sp. CECT 9288]|nr:hypothetical protein FVB9288_00532 [Flavobacterium sp. CECT 9288]